MTHVSMDDGHQLEQAGAILATASSLIDQALSTLKSRTLEGDRVSPAKLDDHQLISYELSLSWAECTAARFLLEHAPAPADEFQRVQYVYHTPGRVVLR